VRTTPTLSPAAQAAQVVGVLKGVAGARRPALRRLNAARSAAAQGSAAAAVERAYAAGVKQLTGLPALTRSAAPTQSIDRTLTRLARAYSSLSADARGLRKLRYASELAAIERGEHTLRVQTKALS
jgi:hypothetical protein